MSLVLARFALESGRAFSCPAGPIKKFGCGLRGGFGARLVEHFFERANGHADQAADPNRRNFSALRRFVRGAAGQGEIALTSLGDAQGQRFVVDGHFSFSTCHREPFEISTNDNIRVDTYWARPIECVMSCIIRLANETKTHAGTRRWKKTKQYQRENEVENGASAD